MTDWHRIHDFVEGYGFEEHIPDNEEVLENHPDDPIRWKVVRTKIPPRYIYDQDVLRLLPGEDYPPKHLSKLDEIHAKLEPLLKKEHEEWLKNYREVKFDSITITVPRHECQLPDIRDILSSGDSLKGDQD